MYASDLLLPARRLLLVLVLMLGTFPNASEARDLDLENAIKTALAESPTMEAAAASISAKESELTGAKRWARPTVSLDTRALGGGGDATSFIAVQGGDDPEDPRRRGGVYGGYVFGGLNLAMPLYDNGAWLMQESPGEAQAAAEYDKARSEKDVQANDLANKVMQSFLAVVEADEVSALQRELYQSRLEQLEITKEKVAAKAVSPTEEYALETAIASNLADLRAAERKRERESAQLRLLMGMARDVKLELESVPEQVPHLPPVNTLVDQAHKLQPQVRVKESDVALATAQLEQARGELKPSLFLVGNAALANDLERDEINDFYAGGVNLSMTLLDFGQGSARTQAKTYEVLESRESLQVLADTITYDVYSAYDAVEDAREKILSKTKKLEQAQYEESAVKAKREERLASLDEVLAKENDTLSVRLELIEARYQAWTAYSDLHEAIGATYPSGKLIAGAR